MATFPFEMVLWKLRTIFILAGFLSILDSFDMKTIFFSSLPDLGASISSLVLTSLSSISSFAFSFHRPYVDIAVGCIVIILHFSSKKYRKPPKELGEKTQKDGELLIIRPSLPLLTCHQHVEPPVLASPPQTSRCIDYPIELSPSKSDLLYHHPLKTKVVESFPPVVGNRKHPTMAQSRPLQVCASPSGSKYSSGELETSAHIPGKRSMSGDYQSLNERPVRISGVGSISCRHTAASRLARGATPMAPSLWKPLPEDQLFLLNEDVDLLGGDLDTAPLPPPPWPGSDSGDEEERDANDPSGLTCRDITAGLLLKKHDRWEWDSPELNRETTRRMMMKKSSTFKKPRKDARQWAMSPPKLLSEPQALFRKEASLSRSTSWRQPLEKEELQRRSDAFIKKMRNDMWLERRQESGQQHRDMISRGTP